MRVGKSRNPRALLVGEIFLYFVWNNDVLLSSFRPPASQIWQRYNDPYLNRFLQPDTIIPDQYNPQSLNRYSYVGNNPINRADPTGHKCVGEDGECSSDSGKTIGGGFTKTHSAGAQGCGKLGQMKCNGNKPTYGDGLIGPQYHPTLPGIQAAPITGWTGFGVKPIGWSGTLIVVGGSVSVDILWINPHHELAVNLNFTGKVGGGLGTSVDLFHPEGVLNTEHASDLAGLGYGMEGTFVPELGASFSENKSVTPNPDTAPEIWEGGVNAGAEGSVAYTGSYTVGIASVSFDDFSTKWLVGTPLKTEFP